MTIPEEPAAYCLWCGTAMVERELFGRPRKACPECPYVHFRATPTAVGAVICRGREVLLVRRAIEPGKGQWGFPAGFQDYGETAPETAVREAREETGLEIELGRVLDVPLSRANPHKLVNVVVYLARPVAGEVAAADDASEARFFPLDQLPADIGFESNRDILLRLQRQFPNGDIH
ncbi:MAG: NUDIX hydrolase [Planctomycetota bacterium]|jgi:ADP-ribose pyrophosphatase YjhB (NUDIX family)